MNKPAFVLVMAAFLLAALPVQALARPANPGALSAEPQRLIGKNRLPAPKVSAPISGNVIVLVFAGPIRFEHSGTPTMPPTSRS